EMAESYLAGIGYDEFHATPYRFLDIGTDYGMVLSGIGAYGENATGLADLGDCIGHRPTSETLDQTGYSGGMAEPGTVIYIICTHHRAGKFLYNVVILIGAFSRRDGGKLFAGPILC
ncbi:unnamed protein product, partial [marine sediment metagenome]